MTNNNVNANVNTMQTQKAMPKPSNEIDMQAMTINPFLSSEFVSDRVRNMFREFEYIRDEEGEIILDNDDVPQIKLTKDLWPIIEMMATIDGRVGNNDKKETFFIRYQQSLASHLLVTMPSGVSMNPAFIAFNDANCINETSQSKNGKRIELFNTFFSNTTHKTDEPIKRNFFGLGKKNKME